MGEFRVDKEGHLMHGQFWEWSSGVPRSEGGKVLLTNETECCTSSSILTHFTKGQSKGLS